MLFSGLTPSSRQRKFCEGFLFFPIKHLRKYGNFIFRQYGRHSRVKYLLDMTPSALDYNRVHAIAIDAYIREHAAPKALKVLQQVEVLHTVMKESAIWGSGFIQDVTDLTIHYYQEVTVYHGVVLRNLQEELQSATGNKKNEPVLWEPGYDHISKVHKLISEFVAQGKAMGHMLDNVIGKEYLLAGDNGGQLSVLQENIREMLLAQQQLNSLLKEWALAKNLHELQTYYN
ncbi:hypothetical protein ACDQ55_08975 [Chitinophaga sp. 30R24]|uniref:hypothetical protein n=1 Tax=Chitinophaga sp. 30R24 TaxID=3248838 RepID=UPI003B90CD77